MTWQATDDTTNKALFIFFISALDTKLGCAVRMDRHQHYSSGVHASYKRDIFFARWPIYWLWRRHKCVTNTASHMTSQHSLATPRPFHLSFLYSDSCLCCVLLHAYCSNTSSASARTSQRITMACTATSVWHTCCGIYCELFKFMLTLESVGNNKMGLQEVGWGTCTGLIWLRLGTGGGLLWVR
jgi:hypothetical protein